MIVSPGPYRPRPIRFLELWRDSAWSVKIYGISEQASLPPPSFVDTAKRIAGGTLPSPAVAPHRYGAAFVTIHHAAMFHQILVDWWEQVNELRHRVFKARPERPDVFEEITATGEAFCIWELRVIGFERDAWLEAALKSPEATGVEDYLEMRLDEDA